MKFLLISRKDGPDKVIDGINSRMHKLLSKPPFLAPPKLTEEVLVSVEDLERLVKL